MAENHYAPDPGVTLDLEPIEARERAATVGPWTIVKRGRWRDDPNEDEEQYVRFGDPEQDSTLLLPADAEFIAHAREDVPALIAEIRSLRAALARRASLPTAQEWKCFHCGEVFTDEAEAREHFGADEWKTPACRLSTADVKQLRELEDHNAELRRENATLENDARLWHESEADRVRRIGNVQWWQELDYREGEKLVLRERIANLEAKLAASRSPDDGAVRVSPPPNSELQRIKDDARNYSRLLELLGVDSMKHAERAIRRVSPPPQETRKPCMCGSDVCIRQRELLDGYVCVREVGLAALRARAPETQEQNQ